METTEETTEETTKQTIVRWFAQQLLELVEESKVKDSEGFDDVVLEQARELERIATTYYPNVGDTVYCIGVDDGGAVCVVKTKVEDWKGDIDYVNFYTEYDARCAGELFATVEECQEAIKQGRTR